MIIYSQLNSKSYKWILITYWQWGIHSEIDITLLSFFNFKIHKIITIWTYWPEVHWAAEGQGTGCQKFSISVSQNWTVYTICKGPHFRIYRILHCQMTSHSSNGTVLTFCRFLHTALDKTCRKIWNERRPHERKRKKASWKSQKMVLPSVPYWPEIMIKHEKQCWCTQL